MEKTCGKRTSSYLILYILILLGFSGFGSTAGAASLIVTSGADDGSAGTLRYAVEKAYSGQTISFEVDTVTPHDALLYPEIPHTTGKSHHNPSNRRAKRNYSFCRGQHLEIL